MLPPIILYLAPSAGQQLRLEDTGLGKQYYQYYSFHWACCRLLQGGPPRGARHVVINGWHRIHIQSHSNLEHNITNIILVDASESLNGSRVEAYARGYIRLNVICLIFAWVLVKGVNCWRGYC